MNKLNQDIALIGMTGSGKSIIGKLLAKECNTSFYDVDEYIEDKYGMKISEVYKQGEEYFRQIENQSIEEVINLSPRIIATGGGVIKSRKTIQLLKKNRLVIFINRPLEEIIKDIDINRPIFNGDVNKINKLYKERYPIYKGYSDIEIINSGDINSVINMIIQSLDIVC